MNILEEARTIRNQIDNVTDAVDEKTAAQNKDLYYVWNPNTKYDEGNRRRFNDRLYECRQGHTSEAQHTPDLIPALWKVIDDGHSGTIDDPIPAVRNMEYTKGLYYLDEGKMYLMNRQGMQEGETVVLAYLPSELVGQYFEEVIK